MGGHVVGRVVGRAGDPLAPGRAPGHAAAVRVGLSLGAVIALATGVLAPATVAADEDIASGTPAVGQCLDIPVDDLQGSGFFAEPVVVDCARPHTFEVTRVEELAGSGDPFAYAAESCTLLGVWNEVGVNRPVAGVVREPLSVESRFFGVQGPTPTLVCGAVAVTTGDAGRREVAVLTRPLAELSARSRADLRYCSPGARGRRTVDVSVATSCDTRPRWQVDALIVWTAFYDSYPGRTELRTRAQRVCGPQARAVLPSRAEWGAGPATTWCLSWYP